MESAQQSQTNTHTRNCVYTWPLWPFGGGPFLLYYPTHSRRRHFFFLLLKLIFQKWSTTTTPQPTTKIHPSPLSLSLSLSLPLSPFFFFDTVQSVFGLFFFLPFFCWMVGRVIGERRWWLLGRTKAFIRSFIQLHIYIQRENRARWKRKRRATACVAWNTHRCS